MGLFNNIFGSSSTDKVDQPLVPWKLLNSLEQLDQIVEVSRTKPVAIFKHSTTCGISRMVLRGIESQYDIDTDQLDIYYLDLKAYRAVSNEVAARFQVWHESPQMLLIKNGTAVYNDSHSAITVGALKDRL